MQNDNPPAGPASNSNGGDQPPEEKDLKDRINRLGGEAAPDITPEEFARLQRTGSMNIDAQGRIRANRRDESDPGASLRKRRAWYG